MAKSTHDRARRPIATPTGFNFIEKLLVFQVMPTTTVPKDRVDNNIWFAVNQAEQDNGMCFLVHVDKNYDIIFGDSGKRPDYLSIFISGSECIWTIIELKVRSVDEAVEQITRFAERLREEFQRCLPSKLHPHIQGMVISKPGVQSPQKLLDRLLKKEKLAIRHHLSTAGPDICKYVSTKLNRESMYLRPIISTTSRPNKARSATAFERLIRTCAVQSPCQHSVDVRSGCEGVTVRYKMQETEIILHARPDENYLRVFAPTGANLAHELEACVQSAQLKRKIKVAAVL